MKRWLIRIAIGGLVLLALVLVAEALFLGKLVKKGVETIGPRATLGEVKLGGAEVGLFAGRARLQRLWVGNPPGYQAPYAITVGHIAARVKTGSLLSHKIIIDTITVDSPKIIVEGSLRDNNLTRIQKNINDYIRRSANSAPDGARPGAAGAGRKYQVNNLVITGASLEVSGILSHGQNLTVALPEIHLSNLGAGPEGITGPELAQKTLAALTDCIATTAADSLSQLGRGILSAGKHVDLRKAAEKLRSLLNR